MRHGEGLRKVDFSLDGKLNVLRLDLNALQPTHPLVDNNLATEIAQSNLGQP
jgi:hypothetical protein